MEQFRQIGEVLGSLKALMVLQDEIQINGRQCCLLLDMFTLAFNTIAEEIKQNLKLDERNTKWKPLEEPLRELHRVFKEGELYIRRCLDNKDWWGKAITLHQNRDSIEFHVHNLLWYFPAVIEAIETAGEISGLDPEEMQKKRVMLLKKYEKSWNDPKLFQWRFGKQYLVTQEICNRFDSALREDRWLLTEAIREKKKARSLAKNEQRLADLLLKKINGVQQLNAKLPPSSILVGSEDYQVRRRLGGSQYKEVHWLGESFALRHFHDEIEPLCSEVYSLLSLSHPNIVQYLCGFYDEERKECFLLMELMCKDLYSYMKENSTPKKRVMFPLPVVVDMMLQVARGMEFLHSQKIYHGDLNPTNVFLKPRKSTEGYFHVKVSGFGLTSVENRPSVHSPVGQNQHHFDPYIWYAPEVLAEKEKTGSTSDCKYTEKADVYSFGMFCFELLTGKLPFEDGHLQGDQMMKNIRTGERPLFPFQSPKYLVNLTKKCWHTDPSYRPTFSSICRVLRYIKKFLVLNPSDGQPDMQSPAVDYSELEAAFLRKYPLQGSCEGASVSQVPFQMFVYRLAEKDKTSSGIKFKNCESSSEAVSNGCDDNASVLEDPVTPAVDARSTFSDMKTVYFDLKSVCTDVADRKVPSDLRSVSSEPADKKLLLIKKPANVKVKRTTAGKPKIQTPTRSSSTWSPSGRLKTAKETHKTLSISTLSPIRRRPSADAEKL